MNSYDNATKSPKENRFTGPVFSLPGGKIGTQLQRNCAKKGERREEEEEEGQKENFGWLKRDLPKQKGDLFTAGSSHCMKGVRDSQSVIGVLTL